MSPEEQDDDGDESDKHLEARDRRYSCLIRVLQCSFFSFLSMLNTMASEQGQLYLTKNLERGVVNEKILDFFRWPR